MKVYELAKELQVSSTEVLQVLKELGTNVKSANANLTNEQVDMVRLEFANLTTVTETISEQKNTEIKTKKKTDADYRPEEMIPCRSVFPGVLIFTGDHSGMTYTFNGMGDRRNIEYQDLKAGMLQQKPSMFNPNFIIEDYDLISDEHWLELKMVYDKMYDDSALKKLLTLPTPQFKQEFINLPITAKKAITNIVATQIENGTFESFNKAKFIDEVCGTNLDLKMV